MTGVYLCRRRIRPWHKMHRRAVFVGESATTLRFLLPMIGAGMPTDELHPVTILMADSLAKRPHGFEISLLTEKGMHIVKEGNALTVWGRLSGSEYTLDTRLSTQHISGLLMALPRIEGTHTLHISGNRESGYIALTLDVLAKAGIRWHKTDDGFTLNTCADIEETPRDVEVIEGDYSSIAPFLVWAGLWGDVHIRGLNPDSVQPDAIILDHLLDVGAHVAWDNDTLFVSHTASPQAISADVSSYPDLAPVLAVLCAMGKGGKLCGMGALPYKESNRLREILILLSHTETPHFLDEDKLTVGECDSEDNILYPAPDHRMVMAAAITLCFTGGILVGAEAVTKSYPAFFDDLRTLGEGNKHRS